MTFIECGSLCYHIHGSSGQTTWLRRYMIVKIGVGLGSTEYASRSSRFRPDVIGIWPICFFVSFFFERWSTFARPKHKRSTTHAPASPPLFLSPGCGETNKGRMRGGRYFPNLHPLFVRVLSHRVVVNSFSSERFHCSGSHRDEFLRGWRPTMGYFCPTLLSRQSKTNSFQSFRWKSSTRKK